MATKKAAPAKEVAMVPACCALFGSGFSRVRPPLHVSMTLPIVSIDFASIDFPEFRGIVTYDKRFVPRHDHPDARVPPAIKGGGISIHD